MTITLRAGVLNSGIQQNGTEFLTVDTSNNATLSNNLTVTGVATLGAGAILGTPASGNLANCTGYPASGLVGSVSGALTSGTAVSTTSGTSIDFTSIPSWVKRITVMLSGVSANATASYMVQIGDSGGVEAAGYLGSAEVEVSVLSYTTGFGIHGASVTAVGVFHGIGTLQLLNSATNLWSWSSTIGRSDAASVHIAGGSKALSDVLDRIRLTTVAGTATFDAGSVNILYE